MAQKIEQTQNDFESTVKGIRARYPEESLKFFVTGSPIYGRFGGNSDIDAITLRVDDQAAEIFEEMARGEVWVGPYPADDYPLLPCSPDAAELPYEEPWEALDELIIDNWKSKGLRADENGSNIRRVAFPPRQRDRAWMELPESCPVPPGPDVVDRDKSHGVEAKHRA